MDRNSVAVLVFTHLVCWQIFLLQIQRKRGEERTGAPSSAVGRDSSLSTSAATFMDCPHLYHF